MSSNTEPVSTLGDLRSSVPPGHTRQYRLTLSESYTGMNVRIPVHVRRGIEDGPAVFVTAALHGNEINGTGAIRSLILDPNLILKAGVLVLVPVVNILGFDRHSRYLPDRRDLNRCFPGSAKGSLASRLARTVFDEIAGRCDFGIDLHTAAVRRTNFPNVRGDLTHPGVRRLAKAFGCPWMIGSKGPRGSLRREASRAGCPTIILEAGEVWKVEPGVVAVAVQGVRNVLAELGMTDEFSHPPPFQAVIEKTGWVRADRGGFLQFHVTPGEIVQQGQALATNTSLLGLERNVLTAPFSGVVIGMTTLPAASPGEPVVHLGRLDAETLERFHTRVTSESDQLHSQVREDLATNLLVVPREGDEPIQNSRVER